MQKTDYDAIIIGAGPAGLTAGIYLARAREKTLIIDEGTGGGQLKLTHLIENYPGVLSLSGKELADTMREQAKAFDCDIRTSVELTGFDFTQEIKTIELDEEETISARSIIIAVGGIPRMLGIPSEKKFKGRGISYCATCDGDFFKGKDVITIGGGNSALEESVYLTRFVNSVTIIHQFDYFQAYAAAIEDAKKNSKISFILNTKIKEFLGENTLDKVLIENTVTGEISELKTDGVFIFIGYLPNTKIFKGHIDMNEAGEIIAGENMETNIKGVFAAGDVRTKKYRQVVTATSDGCIAALAATEYLSGNSGEL